MRWLSKLYTSIIHILIWYTIKVYSITVTFVFFPRQSLKWFTFRVKSGDSIFFLFGLCQLIWHKNEIYLSVSRGKYCLTHLEIVKDVTKEIPHNLQFLSDLKSTFFKSLYFKTSVCACWRGRNCVCDLIDTYVASRHAPFPCRVCKGGLYPLFLLLIIFNNPVKACFF